MLLSTFCLLALGAVGLAQDAQAPFSFEHFPGYNGDDHHEFKWPINKVAIIGAGVGGLISYRELSQAGFDVRVFERDNAPGGNWHYSEETAGAPPIPNKDPAWADYEPSLPDQVPFQKVYQDGSEEAVLKRLRDHRRPRPLWDSLTTTSPSIPEFPWPVGTPWQLTRELVQRYLRSFASWHGINPSDNSSRIAYNTRVEKVEKHYKPDGSQHGWTLTLKKLTRTGEASSKAEWWNEHFDAIVVASGRFNAPNVPGIPGLEAWAAKFPDRITHSNQYRHPDFVRNKTVLVVGASVSAVEVARDINTYAHKVYQSVRIKAFGSVDDISDGKIELVNGTVLTGIDHIIFATGYRYSYPYLSQYHNSSLGPDDRDPQAIVTDGTHVRSLFLDFLYIEEPTIGFINANQGIQTFVYSEYTSLALARIWQGHAKLPDRKTLREWHEKRVEEAGGYGKHFNIVGLKYQENVRFFVGWLNLVALKYGGKQVNTPPDDADIRRLWFNYRYGSAQNLADFPLGFSDDF
ncbi:FAD/NAD(P)-binding domain-containing protein [Hymenopellis radicata]|nr:FAD/NAD(P)-binding domain-containing protein [Hymenopellis radicata]